MRTTIYGQALRWSKLLLPLFAALSLTTQLSAAAPSIRSLAPKIENCSVGLNGTLKVGHWTPVWIETSGAQPPGVRIELTAIDSDGVEVTVGSNVASDGRNLLYTRVGRLGSKLQVRLVNAEGGVLARTELAPIDPTGGGSFTALPSNGMLILQIGPGDMGLQAVLADPATSDSGGVGVAVQIVDLEALPTEWFGYDAVDVVVISTTEASLWDRLAADEQRFTALRRWLELGGRMVVCVGRNAPQLIAAGKPLADFMPGRFSELVRLPQTQTLETFASARDAISRSGAQQNILLPLLSDIEGIIELHGRERDLPILIRAIRGFGELTFLGIDPNDEPFDEWSGRTGLLRGVLRPYLPSADTSAATQKLVSLGYDDLAGALRQRLGQSFAGVTVLGFPLVAGLIIGYLLWLGPLDYFFVERIAGRPWMAWLTLPVIILATSFGAAVLANRSKLSSGPQLNRAEVVDVDVATGLTRGNCWSTLYSPNADRFDVGIEPRLPSGVPNAAVQSLVSWLGLPGRGLGGMHAAGEPIDVTSVGYKSIDDLSKLAGVPLLTAATKSFCGTWVSLPGSAAVAPASLPLKADLSLDADGHLVGSITNNTEIQLRDVCLLGGRSGYRLGNLEPGEQLDITSALSPLLPRSILMRRIRRGPAGDQETFFADRATTDQLLNVMMFYDAFGGPGLAGLPNRYQSRCDLSRLLAFNRAILVASVAEGGQWNVSSATSRATANTSTTFYRFVIPINSGSSALNPQP